MGIDPTLGADERGDRPAERITSTASGGAPKNIVLVRVQPAEGQSPPGFHIVAHTDGAIRIADIYDSEKQTGSRGPKVRRIRRSRLAEVAGGTVWRDGERDGQLLFVYEVGEVASGPDAHVIGRHPKSCAPGIRLG